METCMLLKCVNVMSYVVRTGNIFVFIAVLGSKAMQSPTNILLLNLASADLLMICVITPVRVSKNQMTG